MNKKKKGKYLHDYGEGRIGIIPLPWGCCTFASHASKILCMMDYDSPEPGIILARPHSFVLQVFIYIRIAVILLIPNIHK
jgi:hypothetical protein